MLQRVKNILKLNLVIGSLIPITAWSQIDSITVTSGNFSIRLPIKTDRSIEYEKIYEFNPKYSTKEIFASIKPSLTNFYSNAAIGLNENHSLFKVYGGDPILSEDKDLNRISIQMKFYSLKNVGEPDDIIPNIIVFMKADFIVKEHRMKVIIKDINAYYQSNGLAIVAGAAMSLLQLPFNNIKNYINAETNTYETKNYEAKRIYTVDYKLRKLINNAIYPLLEKHLEASNF